MSKSDAQRAADEAKAVTLLLKGADILRAAAELLRDSNLQWGDEMVTEIHQMADAAGHYVTRIEEDA